MEKKKIRVIEIKYYNGCRLIERVQCSIIIDFEKIKEFKEMMSKDGFIIYLVHEEI